jgi:hypothetical protein
LLEVVLASALCAAALVPALVMVRQGIVLARNIDTRHQLLLYGVSTLEEQLAVTAANWAGGTTTGSFAADGHPSFRYVLTRSDSPANGGISNRLMNVLVTTFDDENGNTTQDASEPSITLSTKIGKFVSYENEAGS